MTTTQTASLSGRYNVGPRPASPPIFDCPIEKMCFHSEKDKFTNHDEDSSQINSICRHPAVNAVCDIFSGRPNDYKGSDME
ncbi:MAG: hypothetical protein ACRCUY_07430 [Thermoguttaceae bacterium]